MSDTTAEATHKQPNYAAVFWTLFILTIIEIYVANLSLARTLIAVALVLLAVVKATLVALFYMHLKFEKYVIYLIVAFPLFLAAVLTLLTVLDQGKSFLS